MTTRMGRGIPPSWLEGSARCLSQWLGRVQTVRGAAFLESENHPLKPSAVPLTQGAPPSLAQVPTCVSPSSARPWARWALNVLFPTPPFPDSTKSLCLTDFIFSLISSTAGSGAAPAPDAHSLWLGHPWHEAPRPAWALSAPGQPAGRQGHSQSGSVPAGPPTCPALAHRGAPPPCCRSCPGCARRNLRGVFPPRGSNLTLRPRERSRPTRTAHAQSRVRRGWEFLCLFPLKQGETQKYMTS